MSKKRQLRIPKTDPKKAAIERARELISRSINRGLSAKETIKEIRNEGIDKSRVTNSEIRQYHAETVRLIKKIQRGFEAAKAAKAKLDSG